MPGRNLSTNFNVSPYFDDYEEDKKFLRILFRPGNPVQGRELTQLQTIINEQIGRFGESIYEDGSIVTGLDFSLTDNTYLKLDNSTSWDTLKSLITAKSFGENYQINDEVVLTNFEGDRVLVVIGAGGTYSFSLINQVIPSGFFGKILTQNFDVATGAQNAQFEVNTKISTTSDPTDDREERPIFLVQGFTTLTSTDAPTLYGKYLSGTEFVAGDEIGIWDEETQTTGSAISTLPADFSGGMQLASVQRGVMFTNSFFVLVNQQTVPVEKYNSTPNARLGLSVVEEIVTPEEDPTLLDNAAGSPNENAPGAHRFSISLNLEPRKIIDQFAGIDSDSDASFYELARIEGGEVVDRQERPNYSVLGDMMAQRFYDVNGNFIMKPFKITFDDKLLYTMTVVSHNAGSETLTVDVTDRRVDASGTIGSSDLIGEVFVVDEIPYRIVNAVATSTENQFTLTLSDVATFVEFDVDQTIDIIDSANYQVSFTPGTAYVNGRKFSTLGTTKRDIEKTRTDSHLVTETDVFVSASFGNYLVLNQPTVALDIADFDVGSIFNLYAESTATDPAVGTARVKQLKSTINDKMELYFFDAKFEDVTVAAVSGTSGTNTITSANIQDRHAGATFVYNSTRYKIVSVTAGTSATLSAELADTFSSIELTLNYNASTIKAVDTSTSSVVMSVASSVISDLNGDTYAETKLLESDKTRLIFNASEEVAKGMRSVQYRYVKESTATVATGEVNLTVTGSETLWADGAKSEFFLQVTSTGGTFPAGTIIPPEDILSIDPAGTITFTDNTWDDDNIIAVYPVIRPDASPLGTKFTFGNTVSYDNVGTWSIDLSEGQVKIPASVISRPNVPQTIGLTGAFRLRAIYELSGTGASLDPTDPTFDHTVVTQNYKFDNGQRDDIVDHAYITLLAGSPIPADDLLVVVDRIETTPNSASTYYSVDSYDELYYDYLPEVFSSDGENFDLRSSLDFRPRATELAESVDFTTWTSAQKTFSQGVLLPHAENASLVQFDIDYYVSRWDKVSITPDLDFKIVKGIPARSPDAPNDIERSLTLYDIFQYAYSSGPNDIETTPYNHDRFTMKDIATLKERIVNIEKTIQLDKVQKAILSAEITDETNTQLLKTGVLVDAFSNTDVADVSNSDFRAAIDTEESQMRPAFDQYSFSIEFDANDVNSTALQTPDGIILAQYDDDNPVTVVEQTLATRTENLNPFSIIDWVGEIKLMPEKDFWKDIVRKPDVVTNLGGNNEAWKFLEDSIPDRTEWNDWNTRWSGWKKKSSTTRRRWGIGRWRWGRRRTRSTYEAQSYQERSGVTTSFDTQIKQESLGDKVVDQSVIPYMRSVPGGIRFVGRSLKPNAILYPFFDDTAVIDYIRPAVVYVLLKEDWWTLYENAVVGEGTNTINGETVTLTAKSADSQFVYFHLTPLSRLDAETSVYGNVATSDTVVINGTTVSNIQKVVDQKIGTAFRLKSDAIGTSSGIFEVPSGMFKTGTRTFKLTDSSTNIDGSSDTNAERDFDSSGMKSIVQEQIVSTRVPVIKKKTAKQSRMISTHRKTVYSNSPTIKRWKDPIAQSFRVEENSYPMGLFLHSVDIWFTSVDTTLPVTVQLLPMEKGYPSTETVIPFGEVSLNAAEVIETSIPDSSNYTRFKFSTPVYLQPGEYAVALLTNSLNYEVYSAVMGEQVLSTITGIATDRVMNKQPFSGVLFKSQNASTWMPAVEEDIMFRLNRASFNTGDYEARFNTVFDKTQLEALAPYKLSSPANHFYYDPTGTTSQFSYNLYQINVPEVSDFEEVTPPTYAVREAKLLGTGSVEPQIFADTIVNDTKEVRGRVNAIRENAADADFEVKSTFGTLSDVVSPVIDVQQMNVIFIQNLIDNMELEVASDVTIVAPGTGYSVGDLFNVNDALTGDTLGVMEVDTVDPTTSGITAVSFSDTPNLVIRDTTVVPTLAVTGTGFDVDIRSELDSESGVAESRYISKIVKLKSGFESRDIKVQLAAYRPQNTAIYVYYKAKSAEDTDVLQNKRWNLMYELSNPNEYSIDRTDFLPLEFVTYNQLTDGTIQKSTRGGISYTEGGTVYDAFNSYRIKVVLVSTETYLTPIVQNLGATALIEPIAP